MSCPGTSKDENQSSDDSDANSGEVNRKKRELPHSVFAHALASTRLKSNPPKNTFDTLYGNPNYGHVLRMYCKTRWFLTIAPDGKVYGVRDENTTYGIFQIHSAGDAGHIQIKGLASNLYIAINKKGQLYGEANGDLEETVWLEELLGSYNTYMSRKYAHVGWFLGLKKSGDPKLGCMTGWGQKATKFLPIRVKD